MKGNDLFGKLFVADRFFTIAIRKRTDVMAVGKRKFTPDFIIPATRENWFADPMLVEANGKTYLFYEAVLGDKGHIEVAEVKNDCTLGETKIVLQDECHYSYPFVFQYNGVWYMIPESSQDKTIRLYKSVDFPAQWELCSVLLHAEAVDTTVFEQNGHLYLLTYFLVQGSERVIPHVYEFRLCGDKTSLKELEWGEFDELRVRGAGPVFSMNNKVIRPAQISREQRYGDALAFYQISITDTYNEKNICELTASNLNISGYYVDGLHTYCLSQNFEAIDIRCGALDYLKPLHKIQGK